MKKAKYFNVVQGMTTHGDATNAINNIVSTVNANADASEEVERKAEEAINLSAAQRKELAEFEQNIIEHVDNITPTIVNGTVVNNPDEEDITTEKGLLKIKDRDNLSGMRYVILRRYKSFREQVKYSDCIYEIRYLFDLANAGESEKNPAIQIPANCILKINGGRLSNGKINAKNTYIDSDKVFIFDNIDIIGNISNANIYPEWFGAEVLFNRVPYSSEGGAPIQTNIPKEVDTLSDSSIAINKCLKISSESGCNVELQGVIYRIDNTIVMDRFSSITTHVETLIVPYIQGSGDTILNQNEDNGAFSEIKEQVYTLSRNQLIAPSAMGVAIKINPVRTKFLGGGSLSLLKSRYCIGVLVTSEDWHYLETTYCSPNIDIVVIGDKRGVYAPDRRDLVGTDAPSEDLGNSTERDIFYWDKTKKTYYTKKKKASEESPNNKWEMVSDNADALWNTSLRFHIGYNNQAFARLLNPQINIRDIYGARGIEVFGKMPEHAAESPWFNHSMIEGSISEKYSHYISIYCDGRTNFDLHDWSHMFIQHSPRNMYDSCTFYAIKSGNISIGMIWDLSDFGSKSQYDFYLGKSTIGVTFKNLSGGKILDLSKRNYYQANGELPLYHKESILFSTYRNIWKYFAPNKANNTTHLVGGILKRIVTIGEVLDDSVETIVQDETPSNYLFDNDLSTSVSVINMSESKYGFYIHCNNPQNSFLEDIYTQSRYGYILAIKYRISGNENNFNRVKCIVKGQATSTGGPFTKEIDLNKKNPDNWRGQSVITNTVFLDLPYKYVYGLRICIFVTEENTGVSLDLVALEYYVDSLGKEFANSVSPLKRKPSAAPKGLSYFDFTTKSFMINEGDAENPIWSKVGGGMTKVSQTDLTVIIDPNTYNEWGTLNSALTIGNTSFDGVDKEYVLKFIAGEGFKIAFSSNKLKWINGAEPTFEVGKTYIISIINNYAVGGAF